MMKMLLLVLLLLLLLSPSAVAQLLSIEGRVVGFDKTDLSTMRVRCLPLSLSLPLSLTHALSTPSRSNLSLCRSL